MAISISNAGTQQLLMPNIPLPTNTQAFTLMCYATPRAGGGFSNTPAFICSQADGNGTSNTDFAFTIASFGRLGARLNIAGTTTEINTGYLNFSNGTRYHLCLTYNGSTVTFYRNGASVGTASRTGAVVSTAARKFCISGFTTSTSSYKFYGDAEDVRIYNKAMSTKEIDLILSANGRDGLYDNLIAWYPLNEMPVNGTIATTVNNSVKDRGPNKLDGKTNGASPTWTQWLVNNIKSKLLYKKGQ